jgi:hypothetical protein
MSDNHSYIQQAVAEMGFLELLTAEIAASASFRLDRSMLKHNPLLPLHCNLTEKHRALLSGKSSTQTGKEA